MLHNRSSSADNAAIGLTKKESQPRTYATSDIHLITNQADKWDTGKQTTQVITHETHTATNVN